MKILLLVILMSGLTDARARDIEFAGYTWSVRSGQGGPGPNVWDESNVWLDGGTNLHLKISHQHGRWTCAEVTLRRRLGFGRYEFQIASRLDEFDANVVLGLFNYPTADLGPDATHEIDIEFARWGAATNPIGNFTVWPVEKQLRQVTRSFPISVAAPETTHRFEWHSNRVEFQSLDGATGAQIHAWSYRPDQPRRWISQQPMPVHINLWLFKGQPPKNGQEVEVILRAFRYAPE